MPILYSPQISKYSKFLAHADLLQRHRFSKCSNKGGANLQQKKAHLRIDRPRHLLGLSYTLTRHFQISARLIKAQNHFFPRHMQAAPTARQRFRSQERAPRCGEKSAPRPPREIRSLRAIGTAGEKPAARPPSRRPCKSRPCWSNSRRGVYRWCCLPKHCRGGTLRSCRMELLDSAARTIRTMATLTATPRRSLTRDHSLTVYVFCRLHVGT